MLKFIRGKGQQPSAERQKLQKELFAFRKTLHHGFPNKPTCLAWDPLLRIFAIGNASGAIKVLGKPGVEFYGHHTSPDLSITKLIFIPNQGRLISLCEDNTLHLWEINENALEQVKSQNLEGKLKKVSAMCLDGNNEHVLLGTEGGHIYLLRIPSFELSETIIYQDAVMQNVPETYKLNPGAVEALAIQPEKPENLLIGYNRGLIVLWNMKNPSVEQTYISPQSLESLCWSNPGEFVSSHNDGTYTTWDVNSPEHIQLTNHYGPYACKAITNIYVTHSVDNEKQEIVVFTGGLVRDHYSDRHTISVLHGERHIVLDFTSKVIDFFVAQQDSASILMALAEEELVAINLTEEHWPMLRLPYVASLHASAVTCSTLVSNLPEHIWNDIKSAGELQMKDSYCDTPWPIDGGDCKEDLGGRDVLLTGHEDGSVRIWDASSVCMTQLYKFSSSQVLTSDDMDDSPPAEHDEEEWPPFKKVGVFDPYSDDPRLAVKKVTLCPETGTLAVAGTSGHVIVAQLSSETKQFEPKMTKMNIVGNQDGFVWKGHEALSVRKGPVEMGPGYTVSSILQLHPPACVTALAIHTGWGLVAAGTAHGLALYDYTRAAPVCMKCTLAPGDASGAGDAPISRRKSFKKSLRESFRRLRRGRSGRQRGNTTTAATTASPPRPTPTSPDGETKPVERAIEARSADDTLGSMVRCLTFSATYIITVQNLIPSLWAGTNNGTVYVFTISIPAGAKRKDDNVTCQLGKEIQLKHRAPVISISVIDNHCSSVDTARSTEQLIAPHKVIITSEEQIKIFSLPTLKPLCKLKLTAGEGARVRRTVLAKFRAGDHIETCLVCLTNLGDVIVLSLPDLRRQTNAAVVRREDINGISSVVLSEDGEGLYLHSSSELERVTVSAAKVTAARCKLHLPPSARSPLNNDDTTSESSASSQPSVNTNEAASERGDKSEIRENGVSDSASGHDVTLSSVGDITIDSVKDHITNSVSNVDESRSVSTEVVKNETSKHESTTESVVVNVVKTSVISSVNEISSSQQVVTNNVVTTQTAEESVEDSSPQPEVRKAPLARMEDMDGETVST